MALAASLAPGMPKVLEYDRSLVASGELWRLLTGQLVHWGLPMAVTDLGMLLLLGISAERTSRRDVVGVVAVSLLVVGLGVELATSVRAYRGSSGLVAALLVFVTLTLTKDVQRPLHRWLALVALGAIAGRLAQEVLMPTATPSSLPADVRPLPLAHLLGGLAGLVMFLLSPRNCSKPAARTCQIN
jgi:rhomboid family GlyGly-CTERM serine protease